MKAAFSDEIWVGSPRHNLNRVPSHGLQPSSWKEQNLPAEVTTLISTCKELVKLSKWSNINRHLEITLKQCVWQSDNVAFSEWQYSKPENSGIWLSAKPQLVPSTVGFERRSTTESNCHTGAIQLCNKRSVSRENLYTASGAANSLWTASTPDIIIRWSVIDDLNNVRLKECRSIL